MERTIRSYNALTFLDRRWSACFSAFLIVGLLCLDWAGSGWVVEGNRQLEMGANVECKELGCVVGGPFKPNKLREVWGLVWRPWINKLSEMTMRCADICHHTALSSKRKLPKPSLSCPASHMVDPHPHRLHFISFAALNTFMFLYYICCSTPALHPPTPHFNSSISCLPSDAIHPSVHPCMHGWPSVRGSALVIGRATEPLWHWAVAQQPRRPGFRPTWFIYGGERQWDSSLWHFFSFSHWEAKVDEWVE